MFTDKASSKDTLRPELDSLLAFARDGDTAVVHSMDRLARNLDDLRRLVQKLTQRGARIEFVKECLTFTDEDSPMTNLMLSVMGAFAKFERPLIRERQCEGIALAKQRGAYRGRKKSLSGEQIAELKRRVAAGEQKAKLAREFGISRERFPGIILGCRSAPVPALAETGRQPAQGRHRKLGRVRIAGADPARAPGRVGNRVRLPALHEEPLPAGCAYAAHHVHWH